MPIFEFVCQSCGHPFEDIVRSADARPDCPACKSGQVEKQLSAFAVGAATSPAAALAAASCGSCGDPRGPGS